MTIRITQVHLEGGEGHEHITRLRWHNDGSFKQEELSRTAIVDWLDADPNNQAVTEPPTGPGALVGVRSNGRIRFLQTHADGYWTNNLLALPRF